MGKNWRYKKDGAVYSPVVISAHDTEDLNRANEFIETLLEYRKLKKLHTTYVKGIERAILNNNENKIYVDFKLDGTVTGRISCAGYGGKKNNTKKGVSFHTLPREDEYSIRKIFVAPDGWDFITADQSMMELRMMAHLSKEEKMIQAFKDGLDFHSYSASLVNNKSIEDVTKEERQDAKEVSFLIIYMGTAHTLAQKRRIPLSRAERTIDRFKEIYPDIFTYMEYVKDFIIKNEYAYSIFGRRRHLPNIKSPAENIRQGAIRQGVNFTVQSPSSDILQYSLLGIVREFLKRGMLSRIVAQVYDSIEAISPKNETEESVSIIKHHMVNYPLIKKYFNLEFRVPFKCDIEIGESFGG